MSFYLSFLALLLVLVPVSDLQIKWDWNLSIFCILKCSPSDIWLLDVPLSSLCTSAGPPFCKIVPPLEFNWTPCVPFGRFPLVSALVPMTTPLERWPLGGWLTLLLWLVCWGWPCAALGCSTTSSLARSSRGPSSFPWLPCKENHQNWSRPLQ